MNARLPIPIPPALQGFTAFNQWLNYRLTPQPGGKLKKEAVGRGGYRVSPVDPAEWMTYDDAAATGLPLAFCFSENDPFFFLDIDNALVSHDRWSDRALQLLRDLPGVAVEISSSGRGLHLFGVMVSRLDHSNRRDDLGLEFYTRDRFVALTGNMLTPEGSVFHAPPALPALVAEYFPPSQHQSATDWTDGPCDGWAGPIDDDELVRRASRHVSAAAAFAGKASFADLWAGNADALAHAFPSSTGPYDASSADAALCAHLAFWTGKDCERMARLLRASGLARDKHDREDYMQRTVLNACGLSSSVCADNGHSSSDEPVVLVDGYAYGSEDFLANQFERAVQGLLRWHEGHGWMHKKAHHWEPNEGAAFRAMREVCRVAAQDSQAGKHARTLGSYQTKVAALNIARRLPTLETKSREWDAQTMLLCTPGGVYDLATGLIAENEAHLLTQVTEVAPSDMPTPVWDKFIHSVFGGNHGMVEFIQQMGGYCLTGSAKEQLFFYLYGSGANGKSVLLQVLRGILGGYAHNLPPEALMQSRNERHPTTLAKLQGKRLAISSEVDASAKWNEGRLKALTGDATFTARFMNKDEFEFQITHKHLFAGNYKPKLRGDDKALARRVVLVPFTRVFEGAERDEQLPEKLIAEYPGILKWFMEGARKWAAAPKLVLPKELEDARTEYMAENNDLQLWIDECCELVPGAKAGVSDLHAQYAQWSRSHGGGGLDIAQFSDALKGLSFEKFKSNGRMFFRNIRFNPQSTFP